MKAAYIEQTGPPDVIRVGDLPEPTIGSRRSADSCACRVGQSD